MPDNNENKEFPQIEITGLDDCSLDDLTVPDDSGLVDFSSLAVNWQRENDEAVTRAVIRVIRDNEDLRRELRQALGLED